MINGRFCVSTEDIDAVAYPVLRHRILTNFNAEADGVKPDQVIRRLIDHVRQTQEVMPKGGTVPQILAARSSGTA